jgi:hypothetical protein
MYKYQNLKAALSQRAPYAGCYGEQKIIPFCTTRIKQLNHAPATKAN